MNFLFTIEAMKGVRTFYMKMKIPKIILMDTGIIIVAILDGWKSLRKEMEMKISL